MTEVTEDSPQNDLTIDEKLDCIMEAVAFQSRILASALVAFDKQLQAKDSKIIKPLG